MSGQIRTAAPVPVAGYTKYPSQTVGRLNLDVTFARRLRVGKLGQHHRHTSGEHYAELPAGDQSSGLVLGHTLCKMILVAPVGSSSGSVTRG